METLQDLEKKKDEVFEFTANGNEYYSTEFNVIIVYEDGMYDLACKSFGTLDEAIDVAKQMVLYDNTSYCMIELQTSKDIYECPDTVGSVIVAYIKRPLDKTDRPDVP